MEKQFDAGMRCDRCGSQAYHIVTRNQKELLFCSHHMRDHRDLLLARGLDIVTDTEGLTLIGVPATVLPVTNLVCTTIYSWESQQVPLWPLQK